MKAKFVITVYTDLQVENYPFITEDVEENIITFEVRTAERDLAKWMQYMQGSDEVYVKGERLT